MITIDDVKSSIPKDNIITKYWLKKHLECIFVFGDNLIREGYGGAAILRDEPNTYGFITKKYPDNKNESFLNLMNMMESILVK